MIKNETKKVGLIGMLVNLILFIIKFTTGTIFKSQGLISDSLNSLGDIFSSAFTFVGGIISNKPEDKSHEFGYSKAEYVSTLLIGIFMVIVGISTIFKCAQSLINHSKIIYSPIIIIIPIITIIIKLFIYLYSNKKGKESNSTLILANSKDHRNDMILTFGVLIGIIFGMNGYSFVDGIVGMFLSFVIILTGLGISKEAFNVLIDKSIDINFLEEFKNKINGFKGVNHIDNIKTKPTGKGYILIVKISVDPLMSVRDSHIISEEIEVELRKYNNVYDVFVHINPDE